MHECLCTVRAQLQSVYELQSLWGTVGVGRSRHQIGRLLVATPAGQGRKIGGGWERQRRHSTDGEELDVGSLTSTSWTNEMGQTVPSGRISHGQETCQADRELTANRFDSILHIPMSRMSTSKSAKPAAVAIVREGPVSAMVNGPIRTGESEMSNAVRRSGEEVPVRRKTMNNFCKKIRNSAPWLLSCCVVLAASWWIFLRLVAF